MSASTYPEGTTKAGRLHASLRSAIVSGELSAGEPIDEVGVAQAHGVSRTPVREALRALRSEGLLVPGPRRQLCVVDFSAEHRREITTLRVALEVTAAREACARRVPEDIERLRLLVLRQRRHAKAGDSTAFLEADEEFHRTLADIAAMPTLARLLEQLGAFVRLARLGAPTPRAHMVGLTREHDALIELLATGDADTLAEVLTEHIRSTSLRQ